MVPLGISIIVGDLISDGIEDGLPNWHIEM